MDNAPEKYARALLGACVTAGELAGVRKDFDSLMSMLGESKELSFILTRSGFSAEEEKKAVSAVLKNEAGALFRKFIDIVIDKRRGALIGKIKKKFDVIADEAEGKLRAGLETAFPVDGKSEKRLAEAISAKIKKTVTFEKTLNKELLGGARLRIGDTVFDATLRTGLLNMRKELCNC